MAVGLLVQLHRMAALPSQNWQRSGLVLVVDDDLELCRLLDRFLADHGFDVVFANTAEQMFELVSTLHPALVLLDLRLPDRSFGLCQLLHERYRVPLIVMSRVAGEADRVVALEMGADDYLPKPFSLRELLARMRAILRRADSGGDVHRRSAGAGPVYRFASWVLDAGRWQLATESGEVVPLGSAQFELLLTFVLHPQQVLPRDLLLLQGRHRTAGPLNRTIDVHVGHLRRILKDDPRRPSVIKTVRGVGYMFMPDVACSEG